MTDVRYNTLEEALNALESGLEFDDLLNECPELEPELRAVLETAWSARQDPVQEIPSEILNRSRTRILSAAIQLQQIQPLGRGAFQRIHRFAIALIIAFVFLLSWGGLVIASAQALPGDQLYTTKRNLEKIRLGLAFSLQNHIEIEEFYRSRRIDEIERLLELGRETMVEFHGVVNEQKVDRWGIGGIDVRLTPKTIVIGEILPGMMAEVEGQTQLGGYVEASEIHLQIYDFVGYVENISADTWQISGKTVQITAETRIHSGIRVGDWVIVSVRSDDFGGLTAIAIEVSNLPTPTITPATLVETETPHDPNTGIMDDGIGEVEDQSGDEDGADDKNNSEEPADDDSADEESEEDESDETKEHDDEEDEKDDEKENFKKDD